MKTVIRKMPYEISQFHETEQWLSDRAAEGLHFRECMLGFASLARGEKKTVRYRLDFARGLYEPEKKQRELYAEMGWEYVTTIRGDYFVFRTEDANAPELHTEEAPIEKERKNIFWRQLRPWFIVYILLFLMPRLFSSLLITFERGLAYGAVTYGSWTLLYLSLGLALLLTGIIRDIRLAIQYKRGTRRKKVLLPFSPVWVAFFLLMLGSFYLSLNTVRHFEPDEIAPTELRFPTLKQVDIEAYQKILYFKELREDGNRVSEYWRSGRDFDCFDSYYTESDPLVKEEVLSQEYAMFPYSDSGERQIEEGTHYYVHTYRCLTAGLAEDLATVFLTSAGYQTNGHEAADWEMILHDGKATVYALTDERDYQRLLLHLDDVVMQVVYRGEQDILSFLPLYEQAMTE